MRGLAKIVAITVAVSSLMIISVSAHSGGTDGKGGHNSSDGYHYHHGHPAHDHRDTDGDGDIDCPYNFDDNVDHDRGETDGDNTNSTAKNTEPTKPSTNSQVYGQYEQQKEKKGWTQVLGTVIACIFYGPIVLIAVLAFFESVSGANKKHSKQRKVSSAAKRPHKEIESKRSRPEANLDQPEAKGSVLNSSFIKKAEYENCNMYLTFASGDTYVYYNVPKSVFDGLINADSPGSYFHEKVSGEYPYYRK